MTLFYQHVHDKGGMGSINNILFDCTLHSNLFTLTTHQKYNVYLFRGKISFRYIKRVVKKVFKVSDTPLIVATRFVLRIIDLCDNGQAAKILSHTEHIQADSVRRPKSRFLTLFP